MAPNMVTLAGLFPNFLAILAVLYYDTSMAEALPLWVNVFAAFSIFMYQTMDAVDGKQARRTGSSSPRDGVPRVYNTPNTMRAG